MAKTLVTVGKVLLDNQALLLRSIHSIFTKNAKDLAKAKGLLEPQELSFRWILSELTANLHHMIYSCKVRKYRTLVYRPNSDLIRLLSEAMWKLWNVESTPDERPELTGCANKPTTDQLDHINQLVLSQIKTFLVTL